MPRTQFQPDSLAIVSPKRVGHAAMKTLSSLQDRDPSVQLVGVAIVFEILLAKHGAHAGNVLEVARKLRDEASRYTPELRAAAMYCKEIL